MHTERKCIPCRARMGRRAVNNPANWPEKTEREKRRMERGKRKHAYKRCVYIETEQLIEVLNRGLEWTVIFIHCNKVLLTRFSRFERTTFQL